MRSAAPFVLIASVAFPGGEAMAQGSTAETYHRCLTDTAMQLSYGSTAEADIYRLARNTCANARAAAIASARGDTSILAALDAADAEKAKNFPAWIKGVRERRRHEQAQRGRGAQ